MVLQFGDCRRSSRGQRTRARVLTSKQELKRVEVIADDEGEIIEAVRRMSENYDFVVTRYDGSASAQALS